MTRAPRHLQTGLSLVELMIAVTLSIVLVFGLVQVFAASRASYVMAQGMARAQEGGRFAVEYLQRDARMVGHMGCVNDQSHLMSSLPSFGQLFLTDRANFESLPARTYTNALRFDFALRGYEAKGTGPGDTLSLGATPVAGAPDGDWTEALPGLLRTGAGEPSPVKGSDLLLIRSLSAESAQVSSLTVSADGSEATILVDGTGWASMKRNGVQPGLLAIADCRGATTFHVDSVREPGGGANVTLTVIAGGGKSELNRSAFNLRDSIDPTLMQIRVYRADSLAYYVGVSGTEATPALYRMRFTAAPGANAIQRDIEELVPGVETLQLLYGQDNSAKQTPAGVPSGYIDAQVTASDILPNATGREGWQRVGSLKLGMMIRSNDPAMAAQRSEAPSVLGVKVGAPDDQRYRGVYETNVALRNRLFGN